jgi:hypothetical protein
MIGRTPKVLGKDVHVLNRDSNSTKLAVLLSPAYACIKLRSTLMIWLDVPYSQKQ